MKWENCMFLLNVPCFSLWLFTYVRIREMAGRRVALYVPLCVASSHTRNIWPKKRWSSQPSSSRHTQQQRCYLDLLCLLGFIPGCWKFSHFHFQYSSCWYVTLKQVQYFKSNICCCRNGGQYSIVSVWDQPLVFSSKSFMSITKGKANLTYGNSFQNLSCKKWKINDWKSMDYYNTWLQIL